MLFCSRLSYIRLIICYYCSSVFYSMKVKRKSSYFLTFLTSRVNFRKFHFCFWWHWRCKVFCYTKKLGYTRESINRPVELSSGYTIATVTQFLSVRCRRTFCWPFRWNQHLKEFDTVKALPLTFDFMLQIIRAKNTKRIRGKFRSRNTKEILPLAFILWHS